MIDVPERIEATHNNHIIVLVFMHLAVVFAFNVYACVMSVDAWYSGRYMTP
jgi:hypothetical protein